MAHLAVVIGQYSGTLRKRFLSPGMQILSEFARGCICSGGYGTQEVHGAQGLAIVDRGTGTGTGARRHASGRPGRRGAHRGGCGGADTAISALLGADVWIRTRAADAA